MDYQELKRTLEDLNELDDVREADEVDFIGRYLYLLYQITFTGKDVLLIDSFLCMEIILRDASLVRFYRIS